MSASTLSLKGFAPSVLLTAGGAALLVYLVSACFKAFKNVYQHPLSQFPGPRLAAATDSWKAWVEVVQDASFCHVLEDLHKTYGE
jgi:hypothetical protein